MATKKAKRKAQPPRSKKGKRRKDWEDLRRRFMAGEWQTLDEMAEKEHLSLSTVYKHSGGKTGGHNWNEQRKEIDRQAYGRVEELIIEDRASAIREMERRHLDDAKRLYFKAVNHLLGKVRDKKSGQLVDREFETEGQALAAMRLAMAAEQGLLLRKRDPDAAPTFNANNMLVLGANPSEVGVQRALRELSPADLQAIIESKDVDGPGKPKKTGGKGDAGAA